MKDSTKSISYNENHTVLNSVYNIHLHERSIYTKERKNFLKNEMIHLDFVHSNKVQSEYINDNFHIEF